MVERQCELLKKEREERAQRAQALPPATLSPAPVAEEPENTGAQAVPATATEIPEEESKPDIKDEPMQSADEPAPVDDNALAPSAAPVANPGQVLIFLLA